MTSPSWNPQCLELHPAYGPIAAVAGHFVRAQRHWPDLSDYQHFFASQCGRLCNANHQLLTFVAQGRKPARFEDGYEPRIYLRGEIQTRLHNWHDFFQVMAWSVFPKTKVLLNKLHYDAQQARHVQAEPRPSRSSRENLFTQFDECGALILASDPGLLDMIRNFRWQSLFWHHRDGLHARLKCLVFGHALNEKLLNPYVGLTAHCLLAQVPQALLDRSPQTLLNEADTLLAGMFAPSDSRHGVLQSPRDLSPFPLLGMPDWADNAARDYYDNTDYFRPGRRPGKNPA